MLGFDIRFDHCGTPSRRLGTSGIGWHSHKYADDQPQLGLILIFFYVKVEQIHGRSFTGLKAKVLVIILGSNGGLIRQLRSITFVPM